MHSFSAPRVERKAGPGRSAHNQPRAVFPAVSTEGSHPFRGDSESPPTREDRREFLAGIAGVQFFFVVAVVAVSQRPGVRELQQLALDFLAVMDLEPSKNLLDVIARRVELERERSPDLLVALAVGEQQRDLALLW